MVRNELRLTFEPGVHVVAVALRCVAVGDASTVGSITAVKRVGTRGRLARCAGPIVNALTRVTCPGITYASAIAVGYALLRVISRACVLRTVRAVKDARALARASWNVACPSI